MAATPVCASASRMEEEEIDAWYEEEKQKCMDNYLKEVEAKKPKKIKDFLGPENPKDLLGNHEEAEKRYGSKLNKIINKYNQLMEEKLQNKKASKFGKFFSSLKGRIHFFKEK